MPWCSYTSYMEEPGREALNYGSLPAHRLRNGFCAECVSHILFMGEEGLLSPGRRKCHQYELDPWVVWRRKTSICSVLLSSSGFPEYDLHFQGCFVYFSKYYDFKWEIYEGNNFILQLSLWKRFLGAPSDTPWLLSFLSSSFLSSPGPVLPTGPGLSFFSVF